MVPVTLLAGSYRVPAEAFLGSPERVMVTWAGFQTVWSGLPYVHAFPVETDRSRAGAAAEEAALLLRTVSGVRLAMSPSGCGGGGSIGGYGGYGSYGGGGGGDARIAAAVACPGGNTD